MTKAPSTKTSDRPLTPDIVNAIRYYLRDRRILFALAAVLILGGIAVNWGWLVAVGLAPILLTFLPCAIMCAVGICMHKMGGDKAGSANTAAPGGQTGSAVTADPDFPVAEPSELIDPVSQRVLAAGTTIASVYQGRIYYFEDRASRDAFEVEPEKYLGSHEGGQAAGTSGNTGLQAPQGHRLYGGAR